MSKAYGRIKGRMFEREIYKDLKQLVPSIKLTMGSGCGTTEKADLYSDELKIVIECKRYKKLDKKMLYKFWMKLVEYACEIEYIPYLIYKDNGELSKVVYGASMVNGEPIFKEEDYTAWKLATFLDSGRKKEVDGKPVLGYVDYQVTYDYIEIWESTKSEDKFIDMLTKVVTHETLHLEQLKATAQGFEWITDVMLN